MEQASLDFQGNGRAKYKAAETPRDHDYPAGFFVNKTGAA